MLTVNMRKAFGKAGCRAFRDTLVVSGLEYLSRWVVRARGPACRACRAARGLALVVMAPFGDCLVLFRRTRTFLSFSRSKQAHPLRVRCCAGGGPGLLPARRLAVHQPRNA